MAGRKPRQPAASSEPKIDPTKLRAAQFEAAAQIERREQRDAAARQLRVYSEMRSAASGALRRQLRIRSAPLLKDLRLDPVALPSEDLAAATRRVLAERGHSDEQIADLIRPGAEHDDAERKTAERARKRRREQLDLDLRGVDKERKWLAERGWIDTELEARRERLANTIGNMKLKDAPGRRSRR